MSYGNEPRGSSSSEGQDSDTPFEYVTGETSPEDLVAEARRSAKAWSTNGARDLFWPSGEVEPHILPGLYKAINVQNIGPALRKMIATTDDLVMVDHNGPMEKVIREILHFWKPEVKAAFEQRGFLYKRGIMLYGEPGSGKTATVQSLVKEVIIRGGIAVYSEDAGLLIEILQMVRQIEPEMPIVVILEDFEILISRGRDENMWLSVMDGEAQINNVVFLATTNYIEQMDKRFTDRPSRFDVIVPVYMPSALTRATFLRRKEPAMSLKDIQDWIGVTEGYSIAHLKELMISVHVLGKDLKTEIKRLELMRKRDFTNDELYDVPKAKTGFGMNGNPEDPRTFVDWDKFVEENDFSVTTKPKKRPRKKAAGK